MSNLKENLLMEIEEFRKIGHKFVNKEISMMEFKHASGGMGVYAHRGGKEFMIRLRIPSGVISMEQIRQIYSLAKKYKLERLHFTTRQAIQYHGLNIDEICDLMKDALDYGIYTRGAGGNYPRNVALSPLSGVDKNEAFDPTCYALATGNYFMERILTYKLPRKLKVSFSNNENDTAHCTVQDLGFLAINEKDKNMFKVYIGGGIGRNPKTALIYPELIKAEDVLYYVEAMVNLFKAEGNYENKNKARIRYIVDKLGEEGFIDTYKKFVKEAFDTCNFNIEDTNEAYEEVGSGIDIENNRLVEQKQKGMYSVYVHPIGGQIEVAHIKAIIDLLEEYKKPEIRLSMTEGVYFRNLNGEEAKELLEKTKCIGGNTSFEYSVSCIGIPTCQMGIAESQKRLRETIECVINNQENVVNLPRLYFSGCGNSCGVHQIGVIGFCGKKKKVNDIVSEVYEVHINGSFKEKDARLGEYVVDILATEIPIFINELCSILNKGNISYEDYLKNNKGSFKELVEKYSC